VVTNYAFKKLSIFIMNISMFFYYTEKQQLIKNKDKFNIWFGKNKKIVSKICWLLFWWTH